MAWKRGTQVIRLLRLARALEGHRVMPPIPTLAKQYRVCRRTVLRDLAALEEAGWLVPRRYHE